MATANHDLTARRVKRSQQFFNKRSLFFYDFLLYGVISKYAWGPISSFRSRHTSPNPNEMLLDLGYLLSIQHRQQIPEPGVANWKFQRCPPPGSN